VTSGSSGSRPVLGDGATCVGRQVQLVTDDRRVGGFHEPVVYQRRDPRERCGPPVAAGVQVGLEWTSEKHHETHHLRARHVDALYTRRSTGDGARPHRQ
jgi:hypothetical protein